MLYGAETWTLTEHEKRRLDGSYTRMLRVVQNKSWKDKVKNVDLYGGLPRLSDVIKKRRLRLAGHAYRRSEEIVSKLVLWKPTHGYTCRGRPKLSFHQMLKREAGVENIEELGTLMKDRDVWRKVVEGVASVSSSVSYTVTTWWWSKICCSNMCKNIVCKQKYIHIYITVKVTYIKKIA